LNIRNLRREDIPQICEIYNYYITHTVITFEEETLTPLQLEERVDHITGKYPFLVAEERGEILGYSYASPWRTRIAYRFTLESTIYLKQGVEGSGIGTQLYRRLLRMLKDQGVRQVMGCLALPNLPSQILHEKLGFVQAGLFEKVGFKFNQWIDVGYWQLDLTRESTAGADAFC